MSGSSALVRASTVQLAANVAGLVLALRRKRAFDIPFLHGSPDHVGRDSLWGGTSYSAPVFMLLIQAWGIARLARGPDEAARTALTWLGVVMTPGYLLERWSRTRLTPGGANPVETPVVVVALGGAVAMALLGRRAQAGR